METKTFRFLCVCQVITVICQFATIAILVFMLAAK